MRLVAGSTRTWPVRWVWAAPGAPVITGRSWFRSSRTWENGFKPPLDYRRTTWANAFFKTLFTPPALGEQLWSSDCVYDRGAFKDTGPPHPVCSDPLIWTKGLLPGQDAPDSCCPPPVTDVIMSWEPRGEGAVVCIGTPTVFASDSLDPAQPAGALPNPEFWAAFDKWVLTHIGSGGAPAAAGDAGKWLTASAWKPVYSGVAGAASDYTTAGRLNALAAQLENVRILWCGYPREYPDAIQDLNPDAFGVLISWLRLGGILVVVSNFLQMAGARADLNETLADGLNCVQQFTGADVGPWSAVRPLDYLNFAYGPGVIGGPPFQDWDGGPGVPGRFASATWTGVASSRYGGSITFEFTLPYWHLWGLPSWVVEVTVTATTSGGSDANVIGCPVITDGGFVSGVLNIPGQTNTPRTVYSWKPAPHTVHAGNLTAGIFCQVFRDTAHQSITIHAVSYTVEACNPAWGCGSMALRRNLIAPQVLPGEPTSIACSPHSRRAETIRGGDTILWYDPKHAGVCGEIILALLPRSVQAGPHGQRSAGDLAMFGRSVQHMGRSQTSAGLLGLVGESDEHLAYFHTSAGLLGLVGASEQGLGAVQSSAGLLGLGGASVQGAGGGQSSAGLLGLFGLSIQARNFSGSWDTSGGGSCGGSAAPETYAADASGGGSCGGTGL